MKLVFSPSRDHELLRRACSLGILIGSWPRVANQRPLELLIAHPDSAGCSCPRCAVIGWALQAPSEPTQRRADAAHSSRTGA